MKWDKKGLIFQNDTSLWWSKKYAGIPTAELIEGEDRIRIYYYSMDENWDGRISYIDVNAHNPSEILYVHKEPIIGIGHHGTFDDCGVCPSCIISFKGQKLLYYLGVQRCEKVPYLYFAGVAQYAPEKNEFIKYSNTPILDRTNSEPYIRSATTIIEENGTLKMWYVSAHGWIKVNDKSLPNYNIRYAISRNGFDWETQDCICISNKNDDEFGFGRPWVIHENGIYKMWYSIRARSKPYCIGYAESHNGMDWIRKDEKVGIEASDSGWDSEMICYPCIIDYKDKRYMFHNGNRHGESGFGYAILIK